MAVKVSRDINWRNFWICFSIASGQIGFGYPSSIIGVTLGQPSFLLYMGLIDEQGVEAPNAASLIGSMNGVFQVTTHHSVKWTPKLTVGIGRCSLRCFGIVMDQ